MASPASTAPSSAVSVSPSSVLRRVVHERLNRREDDGVRVAEHFLVALELVELLGERFDLLHLVVDHLDELRDLLRRVNDRLNSVSRVADIHCARAGTLMPSVTTVTIG
ncbi:MAG: hypothetical protein L0Y58_10145 [Verrucomicrobia subdivision 3 bacterium]|nr:hypothetical protein [Limisphaerales bacterium]